MFHSFSSVSFWENGRKWHRHDVYHLHGGLAQPRCLPLLWIGPACTIESQSHLTRRHLVPINLWLSFFIYFILTSGLYCAGGRATLLLAHPLKPTPPWMSRTSQIANSPILTRCRHPHSLLSFSVCWQRWFPWWAGISRLTYPGPPQAYCFWFCHPYSWMPCRWLMYLWHLSILT